MVFDLRSGSAPLFTLLAHSPFAVNSLVFQFKQKPKDIQVKGNEAKEQASIHQFNEAEQIVVAPSPLKNHRVQQIVSHLPRYTTQLGLDIFSPLKQNQESYIETPNIEQLVLHSPKRPQPDKSYSMNETTGDINPVVACYPSPATIAVPCEHKSKPAVDQLSEPAQITFQPNVVATEDAGWKAQQFQVDLLKNIIHETLHSLRTAVHQDIQNLHLEILHQFQIQQSELMKLLEHYCNNKVLIDKAELDQLQQPKESYFCVNEQTETFP